MKNKIEIHTTTSDGLRRIKRLRNIQVSSLLLITNQKLQQQQQKQKKKDKNIKCTVLFWLTNEAQKENNGLIDDLSKTMFFLTNSSDQQDYTIHIYIVDRQCDNVARNCVQDSRFFK